jgi:hypothetical protein
MLLSGIGFNRGLIESEIGKCNKSRTGQKQSEEEKRKKSESLKKYYAERRVQGYKR